MLNAGFSEIDDVKQTSPQMPASCPGLNRDDVKNQKKDLSVDGKVVSQYTMRLGSVILKHDARRDGSTFIHKCGIENFTHKER